MYLSDIWVVVFQEIWHLLHRTGVPKSHIPLAGWKWQPKPRKQQYDSLLFFIIFIFIKLHTSAIHARYSGLYCLWREKCIEIGLQMLVGLSVRLTVCLSDCLSVRLSVGKTCCCSKIFMKTLLENLLLTLWMTSMQVKSLTAITGKRTCTTISGSSIACVVFFSLGCHEVCRTLYWFFSVKYHYRFNDNFYTEKHNFIGNNFMLQFTRANLVCSNIIFPQSLCL